MSKLAEGPVSIYRQIIPVKVVQSEVVCRKQPVGSVRNTLTYKSIFRNYSVKRNLQIGTLKYRVIF